MPEDTMVADTDTHFVNGVEPARKTPETKQPQSLEALIQKLIDEQLTPKWITGQLKEINDFLNMGQKEAARKNIGLLVDRIRRSSQETGTTYEEIIANLQLLAQADQLNQQRETSVQPDLVPKQDGGDNGSTAIEQSGSGQAGAEAENNGVTDEVPAELLAFGAKLNPTSSTTNGTGVENGSAMGAGSDETQVIPPKTAEAPAEEDESEEDASELVVGDDEVPPETDPKPGAEIAAADDGTVVEDEAANTFNRMTREEIIAALENLPRVGKFATLVAEQIVELRESRIEIHNTAELYQHVQVKGIGPKGTNVIAEALGFVPIADLKPKYRRKDKKADDAILAREAVSADPTRESIADFRAGVAAERSGSMMRAVSATMTKFFDWIGGKFSFKRLSVVEDYSRANGSAQEQTSPQQPAATLETPQEAPPTDETAKKPEDMTADELRAKIVELTKLIDDERNASNELVLQRAEQQRNILKKELEKKAPKASQEQPLPNQVDVANFDLELVPAGQRQAAMEIVNNPKLSEKRKQFLIGLLLIAAGAATSATLRALEATNGPINAGIALVLRVALTDAVTITLDMNAARLAGSNIPGKDFMANALKGIARGIRGSRERIIKFLIGFGGDAVLASLGLDVNEVVDKAVDNINSLDQSTAQAVNQGASTNAQQSPSFWSRVTGFFGQGSQQGASAAQPPLDIPAPSANPDVPAAAASQAQSSIDISSIPSPTPDQGVGFTGAGEPAEVPPPEVAAQSSTTEDINPYVPDRWLPNSSPFSPNENGKVIIKGIVWNDVLDYFKTLYDGAALTQATDIVKDVILRINPNFDFTSMQPNTEFTALMNPDQLASASGEPLLITRDAMNVLGEAVNNPQLVEDGSVRNLIQQLSAGTLQARDLSQEQIMSILEFAYAQ